MSRYKKASCNECELEEINGVKSILRPTRDEKMELLELFMKQQKEGNIVLSAVRESLTKILFNSLFLWENNERTNKKEIGSEDITKNDIDAFVTDNIFEVWLAVLDALEIVDKKKLEKLRDEKLKQPEDKLKDHPN